MKRTIESIQSNEVIWCKTVQEAKEFCKLLDIAGKTWSSGMKYTTSNYWNVYAEETCYKITHSEYCNRNFFIKDGLKITPASEFLEEKEFILSQGKGLQTPEGVSIDENWLKSKVTEYIKENVPVQIKSVPYQLCPMCHGIKIVEGKKPGTAIECDICKGEGIITQHVIE